VKADPGTILATVIVGLVLYFVVAFTISFAVNLINIAVVAGSAAVGGAARHHAPDPSAVPFMFGFGILGLLLHGVSFLVNIAVSSFINAGITNFCLKVAKGQAYSFGDVFSGGPFFLSVLVAQFIMSIAVGLGFVLLIVPGVILALGLCMTAPLIVDRNLGPIDALTASWKLTEGNRMNIFVFWLIAVGLSIAGACACLIGMLLVAPVLGIAFMYIYLRLTGQPVEPVARAA